MEFNWGFGKQEMEFEVPDHLYLGTVEGVAVEPLKDLEDALFRALRDPIASPPLEELVRPGDRVAVTCPDFHRLWVRARHWFPLVIRALNRAGVHNRDISVIIANGTHQPPDYAGIRDILGEDFPWDIEVVNHSARDPSQLSYLGKTPFGTPLWVNRRAVEADHVILTGGIVPHTFAGFGGGRKSVLPGISGLETVLANHSKAISDTVGGGIHAMARPGILEGNPVHEDMLAAARMLGPSFIVNLVLSEEGEFLGVFAGDLEEAHREGCRFVSEAFQVDISDKADIVLASRGGYPMDLTFYQAFQSSANAIAAMGGDGDGVLIMVGECSDGLGPYEFHRWFDLGSADEIEKELRREFTVSGFVVFRAALLYRRARKVILVSGLDPDLVSRIGIIPHSSIADALEEAATTTPGGRVLLMPHASQTIPRLAARA
ncbi:MAG: nickel-dependent lactate racemase [Actinomycetota bacterium]|nr:nickel-dependent lactate racemase [Actinomycetota bacterium]